MARNHRPLFLVPALIALPLLAACAAPPGEGFPPWCSARGPLDSYCDGVHCVAATVVDYARLEPRGYRVFALDAGESLDDYDDVNARAREVAREHVVRAFGVDEPSEVDCRRADDFFHCITLFSDTPDDFLVVIHAPSSAVLFAGREVWADLDQRGVDPPLFDGYRDAEALGCVADNPPPERKKLVNLVSGFPFPGEVTSTPQQALEVALRLNLVGEFSAGRAYRAVVLPYGPAIGGFDVVAGDWYVWLNRL